MLSQIPAKNGVIIDFFDNKFVKYLIYEYIFIYLDLDVRDYGDVTTWGCWDEGGGDGGW